MRLTYPHPPRQVRLDFVAALEAAGFTGASFTVIGDELFVELPDHEAVTAEQHNAIDEVVSDYAGAPCWRAVRKQRALLLSEADWRVQRAEDRGEPTADLRAYRQALRDITQGPDPENPAWPVRPWQ